MGLYYFICNIEKLVFCPPPLVLTFFLCLDPIFEMCEHIFTLLELFLLLVDVHIQMIKKNKNNMWLILMRNIATIKYFNLYWIIVRMYYLEFNNLDELLNWDLATKIGMGILSKYLMNRECNCSLPSKVNANCVYEGKLRYKCLIYKVKCSICDAVYIVNTQ